MLTDCVVAGQPKHLIIMLTKVSIKFIKSVVDVKQIKSKNFSGLKSIQSEFGYRPELS